MTNASEQRTAPDAMGAGEVLAARFRLLRRLGTGGMGEVWEADDLRLDRRVALKTLAGSRVTEEEKQRFEVEARAAAAFQHPNAVSVFDYGEAGGVPFIVMELAPGRSLAEALSRGEAFSVREACAIAARVAGALAAAHAAGIVHRDVKPANVIIGPDGVPKIADFGIASLPDRSTDGSVYGTPAYMAPEQAARSNPTEASDVYALGSTLYELLAGGPPFREASPVETARAKTQRDPVPVDRLAPSVPPALAALCMDALARDPRQRPTMTEFARRLEAFAASSDETVRLPSGDTLILPPTSSPSPIAKSAPPDRRWWLVAAIVVLLLLGMLAAHALGGGSPAPVSKASPTASAATKVPGVTGLAFADARAALRARGLHVGTVTRQPGPAGTVLAADPAPGSTVPRGTNVNLTVGSSPSPTPLPAIPAPPGWHPGGGQSNGDGNNGNHFGWGDG